MIVAEKYVLNMPRHFTSVRPLYSFYVLLDSVMVVSFCEDVILFLCFLYRYSIDDPREAKSYLGNLW